jgi:hypothetical protein
MMDAQMFADLLSARSRGLLTCAPRLDDPEVVIVEFIDEFEEEMVSIESSALNRLWLTMFVGRKLVPNLQANAICPTSGSSTPVSMSKHRQ